MKRKVDGVLLLDKPVGLTSNAALQKVKRLYRAEKAGHTGTLDPLASGLLPLCLGEATKYAQYLLDADKSYVAELRLGVRTSSGDRDGAVIAERPVQVDVGDLRAALARFTGTLEQLPPMHSALKHGGRPLYEYARQGIEIERKARQVTVHALELLAFDGTGCRLRVHCSKGFYVRALADELGEALGCGAHLQGLRRQSTGGFHLDAAVTLDELAELDATALDARLLPPDVLTRSLPRLDLGADAAWQVCHGQAVWLPRLTVGQAYRIYGPDAGFLGVVEVDAGGKAAPRRLVAG